MRLPVQAIDSFQRGCLEDIYKIWAFMDNKTPEELWSRHSLQVLRGLHSTLYLSIDRMELQYTQMRPICGAQSRRRQRKLSRGRCQTRYDCELYKGSSRPRLETPGHHNVIPTSTEAKRTRPCPPSPSDVSTPSNTLCPPGTATHTTTTFP